MSAQRFEQLLKAAYEPGQPLPLAYSPTSAYEQLEKALQTAQSHNELVTEALGYRFEMVRLGMAIAFAKGFTRLSHNEKSVEALQVLQEALKARNTKEIDLIIQKKIRSFDHLYHEIFVNDEREAMLDLFEQTLDADAKEVLDELIAQGVELLEQADWEATAPDEDEDDELPLLDEDFLKNL